MVPRVKTTWAKAAFIAYPFATVAAIVFTGNHYVLDAAGGFAVLGIGYLVARPLTRAGQGPPVAADT
jgi:PAP2 superfamily